MHSTRYAGVLLALALVVSVFATAGAGTAAFAVKAPPNVLLTVNGAAASVSLSKATPSGTATVMGLTTQQLTVSTDNGRFASNCDLQISLVAPDSSVIAGPACAGVSGSLSITALPTSGDYTVELVSSARGAVRIDASSTNGPKSITPDASAVGVTLTAQTRLGFAAQAGDRYSILATGSFIERSHFRADLSIGFVNSSGETVGSFGTAFVAATPIPANGTYFVQLGFSGRANPHVNITLYKVPPDQTGIIKTNGVPVDLNITTPGQRAVFTFKGNVGNRISILMDSMFAATVSLVRPDASEVESDSSFLEPFTLDQAGTWTIVVDPTAGAVGTGTLQRWTVVDQTGAADLGGTPVDLDLSAPGQQARYTFPGTTGQKVSVSLTDSTFAASVSLVRPNATTATSTTAGFIDATTLDASGTWTVVVAPNGSATGTATLQVFNVVDETGTADLSTTPIDVDLSTPGQNAEYTFAGTTGQELSVSVGSSSIAAPCVLSVLRPDASVFETTSCSAASTFREPAVLDASGTWSVVVDPHGPQTGSLTMQIAVVVDQTGTITPGGSSVALDLSAPGQNAQYTFTGTTGDVRTVSITGSTFPGCSSMFVSLWRPDGSTLAIQGTCGSTLTLGPQTLDATGTWTIFVDPQGSGTGTATLSLS